MVDLHFVFFGMMGQEGNCCGHKSVVGWDIRSICSYIVVT